MDTRVEDIREKATRVKRIATRHRGSGGLENFCNHCFELWPCDTAYLLAQLAAKEETLAAVEQWERCHRGRLNYLDDLRDILKGGK